MNFPSGKASLRATQPLARRHNGGWVAVRFGHLQHFLPEKAEAVIEAVEEQLSLLQRRTVAGKPLAVALEASPPLRIKMVEHAGERDRLANMLDPADPGNHPFDSHAKSSVRGGPVPS